jgi:hypothetical protein
MALFSLIIPTLRHYLNEKVSSPEYSANQKVVFILFWVLIGMGGFFGFSGLYEYLSNTYPAVFVKGYMSLMCFSAALVGATLYFIVVKLRCRSVKPLENIQQHSLEQQAKHIVNLIQTDGAQLIKQHPFAAILIGVSIGLLSGITSKQK